MAEPIKVVRGGVFIPEWGNADRDEKEKIRIHYRFLSFAEQQELLNPAELGKSFAYESRIVARMIERVENVKVEDGNGIRVIDTGEKLVDEPGLDQLALESWLYFRDKTAIDKKKSKSESSSGAKDLPG